MSLVLQWSLAEPPLKLVWSGPDQKMIDALPRNPALPVTSIVGPEGAKGAKGDKGDRGDIGPPADLPTALRGGSF